MLQKYINNGWGRVYVAGGRGEFCKIFKYDIACHVSCSSCRFYLYKSRIVYMDEIPKTNQFDKFILTRLPLDRWIVATCLLSVNIVKR